MSTTNNGAQEVRAGRYSHIEALLEAYPEVSDEELRILLRWFNKEASAMDAAMISQNQKIRPGYQRFRAEHIDKFTVAESLKAALLLTIVLAVLFGIGYLAV